MITEEIPAKVMEDPVFKNAREHSDRENARVERTAALQQVIMNITKDHTQFFNHFMDNPGFKRFVSNSSFDVAYRGKG